MESSPCKTEYKDSIDEVLSLYADRIYRIAFARLKNQSDAEDIVQEVFMRYISYENTFSNEEHRKAWLIRVTINCTNSLLRSAWFKRTTALNEDIPIHMEESESNELVKEVMKLPEKYRIVIHLFYYEDLSIKEIAAMLNMKESVVKTRLHRARNLLKDTCQYLNEI